jgi:hypothetical protein
MFMCLALYEICALIIAEEVSQGEVSLTCLEEGFG